MKTTSIFRAAALAATLLGATALTTGTIVAAEVPADAKLAADQTFKYRVLDNIRALDPQIVEDVDTAYVANQNFDGLYIEDAHGNPVAGAAESYDVNADKTVYTFHLRETKWSNGDPVTASDWVFGWQRAVDPALASPYAYYVGLVGVLNADDFLLEGCLEAVGDGFGRWFSPNLGYAYLAGLSGISSASRMGLPSQL